MSNHDVPLYAPLARWWILAMGSLALMAVYAATLSAPAMGLYHDDGVYVVTAKALAEGQGYRIVSLPTPIPQTKYPILFPLGLAAIWKMTPSFPANVFYLKLLPLISTLVWLWLVVKALTLQAERPGLPRGIAVLAAASPSVVFYSTIALAETLFAAFAWGGLLLLIRCERDSPTRPCLLGAAVLCGAAYNTRTIGFTLVVAGVIALAMRRRMRAVVVFGIVSAVLALPWILWVRSQTGAAPELYTYYTNTSYKDWNVLLGFPFSEKLSVVGRNAFFLLVEPARLIGLHSPLLWPLLLALGILAVMGFVFDARKKPGVLHVFTVLYMVTLLLWAWPPGRFLLPVYPLVLFYAALGGLWILRRVAQPRAASVAAAAVVATLAFVAAWQSGMQARNATTRGRACLGNTCERRWTEFVDVMSWLEDNTPQNATLLGAQDPMLYLYTGRKALRSFESNPVALFYSSDPSREPLGPPARLGERMAASGADYLVMTRRDGSLEDDLLARQVRVLRRARAELLKPEMTIGSPDFGVYRIDLGDGASTAAATLD
jgi:hypothetical protein